MAYHTLHWIKYRNTLLSWLVFVSNSDFSWWAWILLEEHSWTFEEYHWVVRRINKWIQEYLWKWLWPKHWIACIGFVFIVAVFSHLHPSTWCCLYCCVMCAFFIFDSATKSHVYSHIPNMYIYGHAKKSTLASKNIFLFMALTHKMYL